MAPALSATTVRLLLRPARELDSITIHPKRLHAVPSDCPAWLSRGNAASIRLCLSLRRRLRRNNLRFSNILAQFQW